MSNLSTTRRIPICNSRTSRLLCGTFVALFLAGASACSRAQGARPDDQDRGAAVQAETIVNPQARVQGEALLEPKAVAAFYQARGNHAAWTSKSQREQVLEAIRDIEKDGLTPGDYHFDALTSMVREPEANPSDLDVLMTDAVAGMLDHVRYGKVRPVTLNPSWNVNPREGAPPLEGEVAKIASASDPARALDEAKPQHFIYRGLADALAQLRGIDAQHGWPAIPAGKSAKPIAPGAIDRRIPLIRARLAASGEYQNGGISRRDSLRYDPPLQSAVELFQARHRLTSKNNAIDAATIAAMNVPVSERINQVRANLERARWVLPGLKDDFVLVNLPAFKVYLIRNRQNVWETRSVIGKEGRKSPTFRANMRYVVLNPDWTVPPTILAEDVLAKMRQGKNAIAEKGLTIVDDHGQQVDASSIDWNSATPANFHYTLRQPPGDDNALGKVKFLFPNPYNVYLHDTPHRELFDKDQRTFSSGCIRIQNPLELAKILLSDQPQWSADRIDDYLLTSTETKQIPLKTPLPVLIVYWTVSVGASGEIRYAKDVYDYDPPLIRELDTPLLAAR